VLYIAGMVQLRNDTARRAYYRRKIAAGKTSMEAMRCLRRLLSDVVYRQLAADARTRAAQDAGPGGHSGAAQVSSAADLPRASALRTSHFLGPHPRSYPRHRHPWQPPRPPQLPHRGSAPEMSAWSAPLAERR
jgi:transposase